MNSTHILIALVLSALSAGCARTSSTLPDSHLTQRDEVISGADLIIERHTVIPASRECVYSVLTDVDGWSGWYQKIDHVRWVEGNAFSPGNVFFQKLGEYEFNARIVDAEPGKYLRWVGQAPDGSGVRGAHSFELAAVAGGTRVINREAFDAWYIRPLGWFTDLGIGDDFDQMLAELSVEAARRCEDYPNR